MSAIAGPGIAALRELGLFVQEQFLDRPLCAELAHAMRSARKAVAATLYRREPGILDETFRKAKIVGIAGSLRSIVQERLNALQPTVAGHFATPLAECEEVQFLRYRTGDFFQPHADRSQGGMMARRSVSSVVFINDGSLPGDAGYRGGDLKLYGLVKGQPWSALGLPVIPRAGLLVAFRSDVTHEVRPVLEGERLTAVSWYMEQS